MHVNWQYLVLLPVAILLLLVMAWPIFRRLIWWLCGFDKDLAKIVSQAKSSDVRYGKLNEIIAPLVDSFPVDIKKPGTSTIFLGAPIDYIHFDPEFGVTFIEVKSAGSKLSSAQRRIKQAIEDGKVEWVEMRLE